MGIAKMLTFRRHMFFTIGDKEDEISMNVDQFSDSFARDTTMDELESVQCIFR